MNILSMHYDNHENTMVKIKYDNQAVRDSVPLEDPEVVAWLISENEILECPYGDFETKGDPPA